MSDRWFGIGAAGAPLVAHRLRDDDAGPDDGLTEVRLRDRVLWSWCGLERRRTWCPVGDFVRPEAFERCPHCA